MNTQYTIQIIEHDEILQYDIGDHMDRCIILIARGSVHASVSLTARLYGLHAHVTLLGIFDLGGDANVTLTSVQHHVSPYTKSDVYMQSILDDASTFHFDGCIDIEKEAKKSKAFERSDTILLDTKAHVHVRPILKIKNNDVQCTHAATCQPVTQDQLWYLETRGVSEMSGRQLILDGRNQTIVDHITDQDIRTRVVQLISTPKE